MKLINSNRFYLNNTSNRFLHLASVSYGLREFICFADVETTQIYIEEVTGGSLSFIADDSLAEELNNFLVYKEILHMGKPLISDDDWLRKTKTL